MKWLTAKRWSPYQVGLLIGVLSWAAFYVSGKPLAVSTTFVKSAAMIEKEAVPDRYEENEYLQGEEKYGPVPDWQWMLVIGIFAGALFSCLVSRDFAPELVPSVWRSTVSSGAAGRMIVAFVGGVLVLFGARMAGGCTSGHGISGGLQLSVGSWTFFGVVFFAGIITAGLLYRARKAR